MEPIALIISALVAGATAGLTETASQAVKDAYGGLKELTQKHLAGKPEGEMALAQFEKKPKVWEAPLKDALAETGAAQDEAIIEQAQKVLKLVQPQQVAQGKYNVQIGEAEGVVIGDNAKVDMKFGGKDND
jgi:hypothetical protein